MFVHILKNIPRIEDVLKIQQITRNYKHISRNYKNTARNSQKDNEIPVKCLETANMNMRFLIHASVSTELVVISDSDNFNVKKANEKGAGENMGKKRRYE